MASLTPFDPGAVERLCRVIGDTDKGLTGREIGDLLDEVGLQDPGEITKWKRLREPLLQEQGRSSSGNCVAALIERAMQPVRWSDARDFGERRNALNEVLVFCGLELDAQGRLRQVKAAATHDEAQQRIRRLRAELERRQCHAEVFRYCTREIVQEDYFNVVFEAVKGLAERIRQDSGLDADGSKLVDRAFSTSSPMLAFNSLRTETERNEQTGLANIMRGIFSAFRNPAAHEPRLTWDVGEQDTLDLLQTLSLVHRRLDGAVRVRPPG